MGGIHLLCLIINGKYKQPDPFLHAHTHAHTLSYLLFPGILVYL